MRRVRDAPFAAGPRLGPAAAALLVSLSVHGAALAFLFVTREEPPEPGPVALVELVVETPPAGGGSAAERDEQGAERSAAAATERAGPAGEDESAAAASRQPQPAPPALEQPVAEPGRAPASADERPVAVDRPRPPRPVPQSAQRREPARSTALRSEARSAGAGVREPDRSASLAAPGPGGAGDAPAASGEGEPSLPPGFVTGSPDNPLPRYPTAARRRGIEGTVTLDVLVSAEGLPERVAIARSSGSGLLDEAALEAVRRWRFRPARRGTEAVEGRVTVPVTFRLIEPERAALP
ncbi:MAG: TonB family protein [Geminicoccaceae bacterium]|nr:TonB family protein [Geminicoccaceae bacterium]